MMWWAVWCAVVVLGGAAAAPGADNLANMEILQMDSQAPDDESVGYAAPSLGGRYASAPWLYLLAEVPRDSQVASSVDETAIRPRRSFSVNPAVDTLQRVAYNHHLERIAEKNRNFLDRVGKRVSGRVKRRMPSLSIDMPMSVLRQKLGLEKQRKAQALRAVANRNFLNDIGKRGFQWSPSVQVSRFF